MKTIYILRHAKSSWEFPFLSDEERPLIDKGIKRTRLISKYLTEKKIRIDLILSSHAVRAYDTAKIVAAALGYPIGKIQISKTIYHSNEENLIDQFYEISDEIRSVMLVGHNPALTGFVNRYLDQKTDWLPTSGLVSISFDTEKWTNLYLAKYHPDFIITPSNLKKKD
ncbi:MAG: hypothetical protein EOM06_11770 [Sphingobacteriia bacterium]|nr:hypothetical protein [Sphingobacteriia bacterium]